MDTASRPGSEPLRRRLVRGLFWFAVAVMPADLGPREILPAGPHAIVKDDDEERPGTDELVASLVP